MLVSVFDDMLLRSIPFYDEVIDIAIFFVCQYLQVKAKVRQCSSSL